MRTRPHLLPLLLLVGLWLTPSPAALAQESETAATASVPGTEPAEAEALVSIDAGVTLTSRFIYRGLNLGEAPQVQPRVALNVQNFQIALWSSHPLAPRTDATENVSMVTRGENYREVLFWMLYNIDVGIGTLTPYVQNHYNPNVGQLFDFDGGGDGAHFFQGQLMFSGNDSLPIDALIGYVFHNDPGRSIYLEAGYRFTLAQTDLRVFAGGVPAKSPFNGVPTNEAALTNVGLSASRSIQVTEAFSLPIGFSFVFNPYLEDAFAAVSVSL
ncbi:MAG: hypothetical protein AAGG50_00885 [Bacteroidota bacterium]